MIPMYDYNGFWVFFTLEILHEIDSNILNCMAFKTIFKGSTNKIIGTMFQEILNTKLIQMSRISATT